MYGLYHDCARTRKRSLVGKVTIVTLSGDIGFALKSLKSSHTLASFSRARVPRSACTCNITCELYCSNTNFMPLSQENISGHCLTNQARTPI